MSETEDAGAEPKLRVFHFDIGDSNKGPIGYTARILGFDEVSAAARLEAFVRTFERGDWGTDEGRDGRVQLRPEGLEAEHEYIAVYFNADWIGPKQVDFVEDLDDDEIDALPVAEIAADIREVVADREKALAGGTEVGPVVTIRIESAALSPDRVIEWRSFPVNTEIGTIVIQKMAETSPDGRTMSIRDVQPECEAKHLDLLRPHAGGRTYDSQRLNRVVDGPHARCPECGMLGEPCAYRDEVNDCPGVCGLSWSPSTGEIVERWGD